MFYFFCISMLLSLCFTEYHYCYSMFCFVWLFFLGGGYINMDIIYVSDFNAFAENCPVFPHRTKYDSALVITVLSDDQQVNIRKQ